MAGDDREARRQRDPSPAEGTIAMPSVMEREAIFDHLRLARQMAAASRRIAADNPEIARELRDESNAIIAYVEHMSDEADVMALRHRLGALRLQDADEDQFERFRASLERIVPPPDDGPFVETQPEVAHQVAEPVEEPMASRLKSIVTQCWMAVASGRARVRLGEPI